MDHDSGNSKRSTMSNLSNSRWGGLFKKIKTINVIKDVITPEMIDFVNTQIYCFKVKSLYQNDYENLKDICMAEYGVKIEYNSQFNIILFHEISFKIDILKYNPDVDGDINNKNYCKRLSSYDTENFPSKTKDCYYFLRSRLNVMEEGLYKLHYLSF